MPRTVVVGYHGADGSYSEREEQHPTEAEIYAGEYRLAIIEALNILGCWHSPLHHLKYKGKAWWALAGEDYEWREAMSILYGALGIDFDDARAHEAYAAYEIQRDATWAAMPDDDAEEPDG